LWSTQKEKCNERKRPASRPSIVSRKIQYLLIRSKTFSEFFAGFVKVPGGREQVKMGVAISIGAWPPPTPNGGDWLALDWIGLPVVHRQSRSIESGSIES